MQTPFRVLTTPGTSFFIRLVELISRTGSALYITPLVLSSVSDHFLVLGAQVFKVRFVIIEFIALLASRNKLVAI